MKTLISLYLATLAAAPLAAQGWIEPLPNRPDPGVVKVRSEVSVRVLGRVAHVEVEEWFQNRGGGLGEGDYLYPLPGEAVFSNFSLFQGDQELRGETMDAARARAIYEEIVRRKKDPALIELAGHGLVRSRVFPINPGETRRIILRYTQMLNRAGDALQFRYAVAGRYALPVRPVEGATGPTRLTENAPLTFRLTADSAGMFRDPFSPTHEVRVEREGNRLVVRPAGELRGDFSLFLPLARGLVGMTLATHRPSSEGGYFMLTLSPGNVAGAAQPRDVTVVLDVSGSMSGAKIEQARRALRQLVGSLRPADRFRLLTFSNTVTLYRRDWTQATEAEVDAARRWVDGISASGGTNVADALAEAFRAEHTDERLAMVVFLTDGLPSVGEQNPERLASQAESARGRARMFAFGVGYDVNTYLLDHLTAAGRGATQYVQPGEDVEAALGTLAAKISHPVLTDLSIGDAPVRLTEIYPTRLPDLFAGEELVIFGRYQADGVASRGRLALAGQRNGRTERFTVDAEFPDHETGNEYIPRLWAARKIGTLTQSIRLNGSNPEIEREIRETALRYGLLSEFTSYLVQEPMEIANRRDLRDVLLRAPAAAPAPSEATGRGAVMAAERARTQREVASVARLEADDEILMKRAHGPATRAVAGRLFADRSGVWTDLYHADTLRVVKIEAFSAAYFDLLRALPELAPYWKTLDRVLVSGSRVSIEVGATGARNMTAGEVGELARAFRGK